jgi:hypothetical protein
LAGDDNNRRGGGRLPGQRTTLRRMTRSAGNGPLAGGF